MPESSGAGEPATEERGVPSLSPLMWPGIASGRCLLGVAAVAPADDWGSGVPRDAAGLLGGSITADGILRWTYS